ncbi:MAG: hypothetical protein J6Z14_08960 [Prevotella sp.]|nr:hypothetical protein [Prevotella sp.]
MKKRLFCKRFLGGFLLILLLSGTINLYSQNMTHDEKYLYRATSKGLMVIDKQTYEQKVYVKGDVLMDTPSSLFLRGDTLWVGQRGSWITKLCGDSLYSFRVEGIDEFYSGGSPQIICIGPDGDLFMAMLDHLIRVEDEYAVEELWIPTAVLEEEITGMDFDSKGTLWITSMGSVKESALCRYTKEGGLEFVTTDFGSFRALDIDENDNIWLASNYCVVKYDGNNFSSILRTGSLIEKIRFDTQGVLWILCRDGVLKSFDGNNCTDFSFTLENKEHFRRMDVDNDCIYISTNKRLLIFHDGEFSNLEVSSAIEEVQLCKDSRMPERIYNLAGQRVGATYKGIKINKVIR